MAFVSPCAGAASAAALLGGRTLGAAELALSTRGGGWGGVGATRAGFHLRSGGCPLQRDTGILYQLSQA